LATARELLEQADALMRRNRPQETGPDSSGDIPVLTEIVAGGDAEPAPAPVPPPAGAEADAGRHPDGEVEQPVPGEIPVLTEVIEDIEPISIINEPIVDDGQWPDFDDGVITVTQPASGAPPAAPAASAPAPDAPAAEWTGTVAPPAAPAPSSGDSERWDALAEDVRMQVLQRIDIFTDTGLQEQLAQRLQPIVDRASADLVATINQHVGQLLRAYVAEAIEREIEKWRQDDARH